MEATISLSGEDVTRQMLLRKLLKDNIDAKLKQSTELQGLHAKVLFEGQTGREVHTLSTSSFPYSPSIRFKPNQIENIGTNQPQNRCHSQSVADCSSIAFTAGGAIFARSNTAEGAPVNSAAISKITSRLLQSIHQDQHALKRIDDEMSLYSSAASVFSNCAISVDLTMHDNNNNISSTSNSSLPTNRAEAELLMNFNRNGFISNPNHDHTNAGSCSTNGGFQSQASLLQQHFVAVPTSLNTACNSQYSFHAPSETSTYVSTASSIPPLSIRNLARNNILVGTNKRNIKNNNQILNLDENPLFQSKTKKNTHCEYMV